MAKKTKVRFQALPQVAGMGVSNDVISGVSVIAEGPALGHNLMVDAKCLEQIVALGNKASKGIKVGMGHESRVTEIVGFVKNFRIEGGKVLGDLHLLQTSPHREYVKELASELPEEFGLSVSMEGEDETKDGITYARCAKLSAVDIVKEPAANRDGLFQNPKSDATVDKTKEIDMTTEEFQKLFAESLAPFKAQLDSFQASLTDPSAPTGTTNCEATGTATTGLENLEATGTATTGTEDASGVTGTDFSALVVDGLRKLFAESKVKVQASPAGGSPTTDVKKTFEELVIDLRKAGKKAFEATLEAKKNDPTAYEDYLGRCAKDSELKQRNLALGIAHKSLVNTKAFSVNL